MPLLTCGINHKSAPIQVREQLAFNSEHTPKVLRNLLKHRAVNEAALLSTCNRTEIYTVSEDTDAIKSWLANRPYLANLNIASFSYFYQGIHSVRHLMRVASGLDSMVLGEPQILGQIKQAYNIACETGAVGRELRHLFPSVFEVTKQIRNQTDIGANPISLAYIIIQLAKRIFTKLETRKVLLVGAGTIMELVATHLHASGIRHLIVANRTIEKASSLSDQFKGHAIRSGDIPNYMNDVDIVITATASQLPIIGKGMVESTLKKKKHRPIFMVDLAIPRDIEPEVSDLDDIYLYNIDDLQSVIASNLKNREESAKLAEAIIEIQVQHYMRKLNVFNSSEIIRNYREQLETLCDQELSKAIEQMQYGHDPQRIVKKLAYNLINKVMHKPTVKLRQAAYDENPDLLTFAKDLFEL